MSFSRFRLRTLMIAVAIVAAGIWAVELRRRSIAYRERAWNYYFMALPPLAHHSVRGMSPSSPPLSDHDRWARQMGAKYAYAADHPWLVVAPDPPEPK